jgi:KRAB domain-containing zinc finger protein
MRRIEPEGEEVEVVTQVLVEDRDAKVSPTAVVVDDDDVDPVDEDDSSEDQYEDDNEDDADSDEDDEWILNTPRPPPSTMQAGPVDEAEELRKRWARASMRRRFRCEQCEKAFKTSSDLKRHTLVHAQVRQFACDRCDKRFARRQDLQRHLVSHGVITLSSAAAAADGDQPSSPAPKPLGPAPSTPCAIVVDQATGQQRFACTYPGCGQTYSHRPNLTRHRKNAHKDALATLATTTTPSTSTTISSSSGDEAQSSSSSSSSAPTSTGVVVQDATTGRFVCDYVGCGKSFTLRNNLARHRNTHAPATTTTTPGRAARRSHQCLECDRSFAQSGDLKRHMSVHSGERPFRCHLCEQAFRQKAHLAAHLRSKAHTTTASSSSSPSSSPRAGS